MGVCGVHTMGVCGDHVESRNWWKSRVLGWRNFDFHPPPLPPVVSSSKMGNSGNEWVKYVESIKILRIRPEYHAGEVHCWWKSAGPWCQKNAPVVLLSVVKVGHYSWSVKGTTKNQKILQPVWHLVEWCQNPSQNPKSAETHLRLHFVKYLPN